MAFSSSVFVLVILAGAATVIESKKQHNEVRKMHFYMHDLVGISTVISATPNRNGSFSPFGSIVVIDDPLTVGPSASSKIIGRARGTYMSVDRGSAGLFLTFTAVLKDGTFSLHGEDDVLQPVREIAIVGGTGAFRFASGFAKFTTMQVFQNGTAHLSVELFYRIWQPSSRVKV